MRKSLTSFLVLVAGVLFTGSVFAQDGGAGWSFFPGSVPFATALIMACAAAFGTMAQSKAASTALEGIARNPQAAEKVQTPMIIAMALMESLVILAFVIAFFLQGKIGA